MELAVCAGLTVQDARLMDFGLVFDIIELWARRHGYKKQREEEF